MKATSESDGTEPRKRPTREWLAEYWGNDWPQVQAELVKRHIDLDQMSYLVPWKDVEADLRRQFRMNDEERKGYVDAFSDWKADLTADWLATKYKTAKPLSDQAVADIDSLASPFNADLRSRSEAVVQSLDSAVQASWGGPSMYYAPITTYGIPGEITSGNFFSMSKGYMGWAVKIGLPTDRFPDLTQSLAEIQDLQAQRDRAVRDYLRGL